MGKQTKDEKKYRVSTLIKTKEFINYADILTASFGRPTEVTVSQAKAAINKHLKKEIK